MKSAGCLCLLGFFLWATEPAKGIFDKAVRALAAGDYAAAERGFQCVLREQPRHVGALGNLGVIYSRTNRADEAIAVYRRALRLSPDDKALLLNLGLVYLKQEAHARALPLFARVVALDPQHLQARQLLAVCRVYTGQLASAIRDLEALRAASPRDTQVLFLLGFAYLKNRNPDRAKAIFEQMFATAGPARAQFLLGRAYYEAAVFSDAEESFLEALRLDPNSPGVHLELGKVYISQRRTDDAIRELKMVLKTNPDDPDASYFLGGLLVQVEARYKEAIPYLERARKLKPDSWAACFYLGKAKLRLGQPAEAVVLLQRAVELNPDEASAYYQLGRALQACGRQVEARRAIRRVRDLRAAAPKAATLDEEGQVAGTR
jgi:cytochrome c-type biogenesis protein CcmH/NrfG